MMTNSFRYETLCLTPKDPAHQPNIKALKEGLATKDGEVCSFSDELKRLFKVPVHGVVVVYDTFKMGIDTFLAMVAACGYQVRPDISVRTTAKDYFDLSPQKVALN